MDKIKHIFSQNNSTIALLMIILISITAWKERFISDDAFISFRYAENFAKGNGLVYNHGEYVEGYTNFLWTLIMSIPIKLGLSPVTFSQVLGILFLFGTLCVTYIICRELFNSKKISFVSIILLGTNYTFIKYGTSGLETQLQTFIILLGIYLTFRIFKNKNSSQYTQLFILSVTFSVALMTRLDSLIPFIILYLLIIYKLFINYRHSAKDIYISSILLFLPVIIIIGIWFIWKLHYYGNLLPNTYYIKIGAHGSTQQGIFYLKQFFLSYWLMPFIFIWVFNFKELIRKSKIILVFLLVVIFWCAYIVKIGGDFMEFRFLVPIMPIIIILISYAINNFKKNTIQLAFIFLVIIGSYYHAINFTNIGGISSIRYLSDNVYSENRNWVGVGKKLRHYFYHDNSDVIIATGAAGAIPFYSKLKNIDILGLTDKWIAHNGQILTWKPGHSRLATFNYLLEKKVNLVISYPMVSRKDTTLFGNISPESLKQFYLFDVDMGKIPKTSKFLEVPISNDYKITMFYLLPNIYVDSVIKKYNFKTYSNSNS